MADTRFMGSVFLVSTVRTNSLVAFEDRDKRGNKEDVNHSAEKTVLLQATVVDCLLQPRNT